ASHRIPNQPNAVQPLFLGQFTYDALVIRTEATVIEGRRKMFGASTRALVHSDDIESGGIGFGGNSVHVMRIATAFQSMQQERGLSGAPVGLPMAKPYEMRVRRCAKDPTFRWYST